MELLKYQYQELFGLTSHQVDEEPTDRFFTNLYIYSQIQKKKEIESRNG